MSEKIGSDVLGAQQRAQKEDKKKQELLKKLQEERAKKKINDELHGKQTPSEEVPGEHAHERKPGEGYDVSVREHRRRKPAKKNWFEKKAEEIREG
jgi:hypothetical protein